MNQTRTQWISFSGGVESTTLCVLFGDRANALFADTGYEHEQLYARLDKVEQQIRQLYQNEFTIIRLRNEQEKSLPDYIRKTKFYPSFKARFCTRMFKIEPVDHFLKHFHDKGEKVELMIGLNADEQDLRTGNHGNLSFVHYRYPLIEYGLTRQHCEQILRQVDLHPNFPVYMRRGGCKGCFYKSKPEYQAMVYLAPQEFDEVMDLEEAIQDERLNFYHIHHQLGRLSKFKDNLLRQPMAFKPEEVYSLKNDASACGVFCNR